MHWLRFLFSVSLFLSHSLSLVCLPTPPPLTHHYPPLPSPHHNQNITWTLSVVFPTVFITGLPAGFQASPSACCVSLALPVFLCLSVCLFVTLPVSPNLSFVCLALFLSAGLFVSPHTYSKKYWQSFFFGWLHARLQWNADMLSWVNTFCSHGSGTEYSQPGTPAVFCQYFMCLTNSGGNLCS